MAISHDAVSWSAVCDCGILDHTHLLFVCFARQTKCLSKRGNYDLPEWGNTKSLEVLYR